MNNIQNKNQLLIHSFILSATLFSSVCNANPSTNSIENKMELMDLTDAQKKEKQFKEFTAMKTKYIENLETNLEHEITKTNELIQCLKIAEKYPDVKKCFDDNQKKFSNGSKSSPMEN